jgi:hypothetical protein
MKSRKITYFKYFSLFFAMVVLVFITGCTGVSPTTPLINSFSASPTTITAGESSTLSWSATDATSVTIDHGVGTVALSGTTAVNPTTTTTYTLTATNSAGSVTAATTVAVSSYALLDIGPAGGYIFYDKGSYSGNPSWRYLEAAPSDQSLNAVWGCDGIEISGADGTAVGTGEQNTIDIEAGCATADTAADICANLSLGGYSDWFLPSKDELNLMYANLKVFGVGGFDDSYYWSSSESYNIAAYGQNFSNGTQNASAGKYTPLRVRAARAF